ncbi:aspartate aminotransferase family protein [Labrys miyagiensis]|uniref:Aspartate aminotransferase family protein n=1 Tax=Labrys miyagiensis TaxID=346912 RepID=A0ABQ6CS74_9HYPH|nr:aspartate aminotransferase family protein [Labrys miyagiensis]GLS22579.1 aspartate aminotransferase family protein [Labrys miyagiensis]
MTVANAFDPANAAGFAEDEAALIARRQRLLGPAYRLFYAHPVHVVRAEGVWLYGRDGEAYLDAYNNVASVGHGHPHVVAALARQAATLNTHTRYITDGILDYAERLLATMPAAISNIMFTCTGSEANDLALRVAKAATGGTGVIVTENAYHGVTDLLAQMSPSLGPSAPVGPTVRVVAAPSGQADAGAVFARGVSEAIANMAVHGIRPAALLVDTIFSSDGVFADPAGFLAPAVELVRKAGGLFIADEVQPGFGRTGAGMWGFARHGLTPDLVTMGKPMGDGHPMAAMAGRPEHLEAFGRNVRYFNTFGGNPVSCAVGMAVLDVIEAEGLIANASEVGAAFKRELEALAANDGRLGAVRGAGLFLGVDIVDAQGTPDATRAAAIVNGLRERRVLISATGRHGHSLKIRPPMVFSQENVALFMDRLKDTLAGL